MIRALSVLAALAVAAPAAAQSKQFDKTAPLPSGGYFSLHATRGSVKLTSWDRNEVEIRARIEAPPRVSADYARESVDATTVEVLTGAGDVRIRSNYDKVRTCATRGSETAGETCRRSTTRYGRRESSRSGSI